MPPAPHTPRVPNPSADVEPQTARPAAQEHRRSRRGQPQDLGIGSKIGHISHRRFINRDGTFNVRRLGIPWHRGQDFFYLLITCRWPLFMGLVVLGYLCINLVFAGLFMACGEGALVGGHATDLQVGLTAQFLDAFFFSVQTLGTIGYGVIHPHGVAANLLVAAEALTGLVYFALMTGLIFSRFSRPVANISFSERALVAPYRGGKGFMFRIANVSANELIEVDASVTLALSDGTGGRKYFNLPLERDRVAFFPLHWVIVHPIDQDSPLHGLTLTDLQVREAEFLVMLTGVEEAYHQRVHARSSYRWDEVVYDHKFTDIFQDLGAGIVGIDLRELSNVEPVGGSDAEKTFHRMPV